MVAIPVFDDFSKLHSWLIANKQMLMSQKKSVLKLSDCCFASISGVRNDVNKSAGDLKDAKKINVTSIINTTKLFDSHADVHIDGLWDKSLKETKDNYLVKEHNFSYDGIISDNVKATAQQMLWSDLGFDYPGKTQALVYNSEIDDEDKTGMFDRYKSGKVKQHSVGMRYVKVQLAVDNKKYPEEMKAWKDYYDMIANKSDVDDAGYFWAVTEAKNIEGSAVLRGSNFATPTTSVSETKDQPSKDTGNRKPLYALELNLKESKSIFSLKI